MWCSGGGSSLPGGMHSAPARRRTSRKLEQTWLGFFPLFKCSPKGSFESLALTAVFLGKLVIILINPFLFFFEGLLSRAALSFSQPESKVTLTLAYHSLRHLV